MLKTILGVFENTNDARDAIQSLGDKGYDSKDISIVMRDREGGENLHDDTGADVAGGTVSGATTGALLGGVAGLLASFVIPGLGAFFIGGPLASALGLTGAAAATASGAATGAVAGGLLGALTGMGVSDSDARIYEERVNQGAILIAIPTHSDQEIEVRDILESYDASDITAVAMRTDRLETFEGSKRRVADEDTVYETPAKSQSTHRAYAHVGAKGGKSSTEGKGWHGDSKGHAEAASEKRSSGSKATTKSRMTGKKGGRSTTNSGRGWHSDSKEHSLAGQGMDVPGRGKGK